MPAFSHRRAIHRTVLVTLAAWALALMAGIASACLPHESGPVRDGQVQAVDPDAHEVACNDAWVAGALTVAKQERHDSTHLEPAAVQTVAAGPNLVSIVAVEQAVDDGMHAHGPPDAIRFLRLRL